jgi:hypothetical protein
VRGAALKLRLLGKTDNGHLLYINHTHFSLLRLSLESFISLL